MKRTIGSFLLAMVTMLAFATAAFAQQKPAKPAAGGEGGGKGKVKNYDFTGDTIDGDLIKPEGEFIDTRKFATHTSLITVRKDFIKEIVKSAEDL